MTSNEEMAEKLAEKFYGLIEGDVSVSGGELAKLFVTALDQAGLALSEKAKAYISFEPVLPNGKTLADMFASSDRKPLGTVLDDEDDEEEDDGPDDAGELDELEHMRDVADMAYAPEPDLFIRTGGEERISNFLLWQLAYTEFYFTPVPWPDFTKEELIKAVEAYNHRDRRYGGLKEE